MKTATLGILLVAFASLCIGSPILTFTGGNYAIHGWDQTVGWRFTVNSSITVVGLDWYDPSGTITKAFPVAIWDNAGNVVVSPTNVGSGAGTWDSASHYWNTSITAVTLNAGTTYMIGGLIAPTDPIIDFGTGLATDPAITYIEALAAIGGSIQYPGGGQQLGVGYFGPNFNLADTGVPEPGTPALLAVGLIALAVNRRRAA
jgi:hypothetical protein